MMCPIWESSVNFVGSIVNPFNWVEDFLGSEGPNG